MVEDIKTVCRRNLFKALARGELDEAAALLQRLREEDPLSVETRGFELEYLLRCEKFEEAEPLARQLVAQFPASPRILYLAGRLAYRSRDYARAEALLAESHRLCPNAYCQRFLAKTLTQLGRFEQAEPILLALLAGDPGCHLDLAWLYERQQAYDRALKHVDAYLAERPGDPYAAQQRARLQASAMEPEELLDDMEGLVALDEDVPGHLLPHYIENLFRTGAGPRARGYLEPRIERLDSRVATRTAWACYHVQAYDLAYRLFLKVFDANRRQPKFLSALEAAARRCGSLAELLPIYERAAEDDRRFYGRIRSLRRRIDADGTA